MDVPALVANAFSVAAALSWNDAAERALAYWAPVHEARGVWGAVVYAVVITAMAALAIWAVHRAAESWRARKQQLEGIIASRPVRR